MSIEFNPMEDLLADLLSTWDEEPAEEAVASVAAPVPVVEARAEPLTPSSPIFVIPPELPRISALARPVAVSEPEPIVPPPPVVVQPIFVPPIPAPPEPEPVPAWREDAGAAAACAAILARMEREFAEREPVPLPRSARLGSDVPRFVVFVVREMMFAVPIGRVLETDRMSPITPLPGAALGVKGLTNLRGEVVPVIDLRDVLGWPAPENSSGRRMLVIQDGFRQPLAALLVDQVKGLAAFPATAWKSTEMAGAHAAEGFVEAVAERDLAWVSRLNLDRILIETHLPSLAAA